MAGADGSTVNSAARFARWASAELTNRTPPRTATPGRDRLHRSGQWRYFVQCVESRSARCRRRCPLGVVQLSLQGCQWALGNAMVIKRRPEAFKLSQAR